jgi:Ca-activated chloride channel homolog
MTTTRLLTFSILALLLSGAAPACAESARSINREGIRAFRDGDYEKARDLFAQAREKDAESLLLEYNEGSALARNGELDRAIGAFSKATEARDEKLAAGAKYSLSAAACEIACRMAQQGDSENALKMLETAIRSGRDALISDPTDENARMNYEIARRLQKQLEQKQEQEKQQDDDKKKEDEKEDDKQDQSEEGKDKQDEQQQNKDEQDEQQQKQEEQQGDEENREKEEEKKQENKKQDDKEADEQNEKQEDAAESGAEQSEEPSLEEKDATLNALNLLDDNDVEALKRMLQRRYGRTQTPSKDW